MPHNREAVEERGNSQLEDMSIQKTHSDLIEEIKIVLFPLRNKLKLFIEKQDEVGLIQVFSDVEMNDGERNKFKIAYSDILLLDENDKPLLIIEPETSSSPKTFGRSIPVYSIAKQIKVKKKSYQVESFLLLMIVIPDDKENKIKKKNQLEDFQSKIKNAINFPESKLKDFVICQISDLRKALKNLLIKYGLSRYAQLL